jgi:hypothetical protein
MAVVREKGYAHWDGSLAGRRFPWLPITRTGIRLAFRKKGFKLALASAFLPAFVALGGLYVSERLEDFKGLVQSTRALLKIDPAYFQLFLTGYPLTYPYRRPPPSSAGLVAEDLKHNALQLYFARPSPRGLRPGQGVGRALRSSDRAAVISSSPSSHLRREPRLSAPYPWLPVILAKWPS